MTEAELEARQDAILSAVFVCDDGTHELMIQSRTTNRHINYAIDEGTIASLDEATPSNYLTHPESRFPELIRWCLGLGPMPEGGIAPRLPESVEASAFGPEKYSPCGPKT